MAKPKLLLVTNGFPFGNHERGFLTTEYAELTEHFDVYIAARIPRPTDTEWEGIDKSRVFCVSERPLRVLPVLCQVFRIQVLRDIIRAKKGCGLGLWLKRTALTLKYSARAAQVAPVIFPLIQSLDIGIVYTYWCTHATVAVLRFKRKHPQLKAVTRFHGGDLYLERQPELWQPFRTDIANGCEKLVFACERGQDYFRAHWPVPPEKCVVAYLGTPPMCPVTPCSSGTLELVSCSNMIPLKRIELIISALALLPPGIQVDWHHIGDGESRPALEKRAESELSGCRNVSWTFHGAVMNAEINGIYERLHAALFIMASSTEGVPVSVQEALGMGIPVIGTDVGGTAELVIDGKTGYLLPETPTAQQIAGAIARFWQLPEPDKQAMGEAAMALWREKCDAWKNARRFARILEQII